MDDASMASVTETSTDRPVRIPEDEPLEVGGFALLVMGVILGFVATAWIGMLYLMHNDPLGPEARRHTPTTVVPTAPGDPGLGEAVYASTCATCHGPGGEGIPGLGLPLIDSDFVHTMSDEELVVFIRAGRPADDPDNTTGVAMPPNGGNPALTDQDLANVVEYLRQLQ